MAWWVSELDMGDAEECLNRRGFQSHLPNSVSVVRLIATDPRLIDIKN